MANNRNLGTAKVAKNDEFYTQLPDIEKEMQAYLDFNPDVFRGKAILLPCDDPQTSAFTRYFALNFQLFGLKKLISTSYAPDAKKAKYGLEPTLFQTEDDDPSKWETHGKIFVLEQDLTGDGRINIDDLKWDYLDGDGDFQSEEVTRLRDEADIIITNPPFSLFKEFLAWLVVADKKFSIIGNKNAIAYKETFPLIKENKIWIGPSITSGDREFMVPKHLETHSASLRIDSDGNKYIRVPGVHWFTNIDHGLRHEPLQLMTMADNIKFSRHNDIRGKGYLKYDNYDAIDVPYSDAIPADYDGIIGVPLSFLDKYCPEQFEIIGNGNDGEWLKSVGVKPLGKTNIAKFRQQGNKAHITANMVTLCIVSPEGEVSRPYQRILIRKK